MTYKILLLSDAQETLEHVTNVWKTELLFDRWMPKTSVWKQSSEASVNRLHFYGEF